jgi:hypothetical protein
MNSWTGRQPRDRSDRYVRRARLSVAAGAPARRLAFTMEEALRLATLPGENQGRSYYFRTVRLTGLPPGGDRAAWLERFQQVLNQEAARAVHGADPRAALAPSVYFRSEEEALEVLLHRLLAREPVDEWYWAQVSADAGATGSGLLPGSSSADGETIRGIVEELRARPASWVAVAAALFAVPGFDVVRLGEAVSPAVARAWLTEMDGAPPFPGAVAAAIPRSARPAMRQSLRAFGSRDPRTLWLATLAILLESPSDLVSKSAVRRARAALRQLDQPEVRRPAGVPTAETPRARPDTATVPLAPRRDVQPYNHGAETPIDPTEPAEPAPSTLQDSAGSDFPALAEPAPMAEIPGPALDESTPLPDSLPWQCEGAATAAAGLFFLLNALERIGVAEALAAFGGAVPDFIARVLQRLAAQAGAAPDDPIPYWLDSLISGPADDGRMPCDPSWWPANLRRSCAAATVPELVRAWCLGVRRWCWRAGRIGIRDVVTRDGVFAVNRTDLDVSLPLEDADIRVRRVGLDLDPGWLPWFGRVVRFHYLARGEFHG